MKNVLILGTIATQIIDMLAGEPEIHLTLFVRNTRRLRDASATARVVDAASATRRRLAAL